MAPDRNTGTERPRRIHIIGGPGSGKTHLSSRLAAVLDVPAVHLDHVARVGGGTGTPRPMEQRLRDVAAVASRPAWVTEGLELGWTHELLERADLVVWLDTVGWTVASGRIVRRFVASAIAEARQRQGRERFLRLRDYAGHLRDLVRGVLETRTYYPAETATTTPRLSRRQTWESLRRYKQKVIHCRSSADVERLVASLASMTTPRSVAPELDQVAPEKIAQSGDVRSEHTM